MELIEKIGTFLSSNGVTLPVFGNTLPVEPDDAVSITDTGGYRPDPESPFRYPTISVMVRHSRYDTAKGMAMRIYYLLHGKQMLAIDADTVLQNVVATQEPAWLGKDTNERQLVVCNYMLTIRR